MPGRTRGRHRTKARENGAASWVRLVRILLVHQNFPGQFRQLAPHLERQGHELVAVASHDRPINLSGRMLRYPEPAKPPSLPHGSALWHEGLVRAWNVAELAEQLDRSGWKPDRILAHSGWGETLGLAQLWPDVKQVIWPELWLLPLHGGYGVDPMKPAVNLHSKLEQIGRNALTRAALADASAWVLPTQHQAQSLPSEFQDHRLHIIHEGIDTQIAKPNPDVSFEVRGIRIDRFVPTITFVNRNLERLRGFDLFMRALPQIQQQHPTVRILIVGDNNSGYGGSLGGESSLKERMLKELSGQLDLDRIHFLGRVPHPVLMAVLQASWVHDYLSYPFILGWSLLEAMACGCCIVGSEGMPVAEAITDGVDGVLTPMDQPQALADHVLSLLANQQLREGYGKAARRHSLMYDQRLTLKALTQLIAA